MVRRFKIDIFTVCIDQDYIIIWKWNLPKSILWLSEVAAKAWSHLTRVLWVINLLARVSESNRALSWTHKGLGHCLKLVLEKVLVSDFSSSHTGSTSLIVTLHLGGGGAWFLTPRKSCVQFFLLDSVLIIFIQDTICSLQGSLPGSARNVFSSFKTVRFWTKLGRTKAIIHYYISSRPRYRVNHFMDDTMLNTNFERPIRLTSSIDFQVLNYICSTADWKYFDPIPFRFWLYIIPITKTVTISLQDFVYCHKYTDIAIFSVTNKLFEQMPCQS